MRQGSIILFTMMLLVIHAFSQRPAFAVKAGLSQGNVGMCDPLSQFENKFNIGIHTGVNTDIPVAPRMTVQSELQYAMFGAVYTSGDQKARYKTNYLLLPVMAKYSLDNGLSFLCGPQGGVLVRAKSVIAGRRYDLRDDMKKTDFFLVFGVNYKLQNGIGLGFRYQHGLMKVENGAAMSLKNRGFSVNVSYHLGNGSRNLLDKLF
ncbi:MAG TPA: porin family protein [Saprospiraceae bacterium]|nr:porin family protein [Saprospiraceae bacterium]